MPIRTLATLAVAVLLGLIAVFLVRNYLGAARKAATGPVAVATTPVVVAALPIPRGIPLAAPLLKLASFPADSVPAGSFQSVEQLISAGAKARVALRGLAPNEPILASSVTGPGGRLNLSGTLGDGLRAVSIRTSDVSGVGGFVLPGDRVDILLTRSVGSGDESTALTQVLAQNVRVVGVDQLDNQEADKPLVAKTVTVEVTPDQAQAVSLAQAVGTVSFTLRSVADVAALARRVTTIKDLAAFVLPKAPPAAAPTGLVVGPGMRRVQVTRGVDMSAYAVSAR